MGPLGAVVLAAGLAMTLAPGCEAEGAGARTGAAPVAEPAPRAPAAAAAYRSPALERDVARAAAVVETRGYASVGSPWRGFLVQQAPATRPLRLQPGTCTVAIAASSEAVRELDLRVYDADGGEVGQDTLVGRDAALRFCPSQSGTYYLVARATAGNGLFVSRRFQGPAGLDVRIDDLFRPGERLGEEGEARTAGGEPPVARP